MTRVLPLALLMGLPLGCSVAPPDDGLDLLTPREQLIRLSVDLRGIHPSEVDLRKFERDPFSWDAFVDEWIEDPRFVDRTLEVFNHRYLSRTGASYFDAEEAGIFGIDDGALGDQVSEEPLALLRYVIENELPYSYVVTAEHTMATPVLAQFWDLDYPDGATGWQPATYRDGRPHSGVLTMSTTWQRYPSMGGNANRHRANAVSIMFLCDDYLSRPVVLNRAAVDQLTIDPEEAVATNAGCQSCHATLDPLAANFFGFFNYDPEQGIDQTIYRAENEQEWTVYAGRPPAYFGRPTANLDEFGQQLAEDPRFADCAVQTAFEGFTQRTATTDDWDELQHHTGVFLAHDQSVKELVRSIVTSMSYRARGHADGELDGRLAGVKTASPAQLASIMEGITGYRWAFSGRDGLTTNDIGLPVLAGGIDSDLVKTPTRDPSVGTVFVQERLAQSAAWHVAVHDLDPNRTEPATLLEFVTINDTPENNPDAFEAQIRHLYLAATGLPLGAEATEPDSLIAVWKYVYSVEASSTSAWAAVTSAVLRDPRILFY